MRIKWAAASAAVLFACTAAAVAFEPWVPASPIVYETVSGWPMRVYYRNGASYPVRVVGAGGIPALSAERPLSDVEIDKYFDAAWQAVRADDTVVRAGDYVRFNVEDPEGLAWEPDKMQQTSWFYVFAILESARPSMFKDKWVNEVCLVSKTHEPFKHCREHNAVYAVAGE